MCDRRSEANGALQCHSDRKRGMPSCGAASSPFACAIASSTRAKLAVRSAGVMRA